MTAVSADWAILDLVVDTAFCNLESFSALGCLDEIVQLCFARVSKPHVSCDQHNRADSGYRINFFKHKAR